jgi:hypothetical protein
VSAPEGGFCLDCGEGVASFAGLAACPSCGSQSVPCSHADQVSVTVNWHELRVLVMWAEGWQRHHQLGRTVYAIADRIAAQHPERARQSPLSLAADLGDLAKHHEIQVSDPDLRRDIAEQTGEETGLFSTPRPPEDGT